MVRHVIVWTLKEASEEEKAVFRQEIREALEGLNGHIPGLVSARVYTEGLPSSNGDLMLDTLFEDEASLKAYAVHPLHVAAANGHVRPHTASRSCFDYIVPEEE
ncbi:MAG: Dabb family protein [Clostridia bacterium]|nr:Dabb family protein [Clostridia bacterium]